MRTVRQMENGEAQIYRNGVEAAGQHLWFPGNVFTTRLTVAKGGRDGSQRKAGVIDWV